MDWLVFGDDFGAHPSTTQHLIGNLPTEDRVIWVNSIGMRAPKATLSDLRRIAGRLRATFARRPSEHRQFERPPNELQPSDDAPTPARSHGPRIEVLHPTLAPWHDQRAARAVNRQILGREIGRAMRRLGITELVALYANPIARVYLEGLAVRRAGYLRLDDYPRLPGVDAALVTPFDDQALAEAELVFATARALLRGPEDHRRIYLPQGVNVAHFATVSAAPPAGKVLGFFGLLAEWLDFDLAAAVARECPDWTLEFRGPIRSAPESLFALPNVTHLPALPYAALPAAISHWRAAWIPFRRSALTDGVNPLKLREYLAAGLPTASTPLPEVVALGGDTALVETATDVRRWLEQGVLADTEAARLRRRAGMASHDWRARAEQLRGAFRDGPGVGEVRSRV